MSQLILIVEDNDKNLKLARMQRKEKNKWAERFYILPSSSFKSSGEIKGICPS